MNYIAHLHIASVTGTSLLGNFLGDFVKGSDLRNYSADLQKGIRLHRRVDQLTDSSVIFLQLKQQFPDNLRKTAPIVLDVIFDHLLIKHWQRFAVIDKQRLFEQFYIQLEQHTDIVSERFARVRKSLLTDRWLSQYEQLETCYFALQSIEQRFKRKIVFADQSYTWCQDNQLLIEEGFLQFFPELVSKLKTA